MQNYLHSVTLDSDKCMGCINCIKRCPTEAIRVRNGKAKIIKERCIDCGECIRVCPYFAKKALTDPLSMLAEYKYKIALPAPSLYGQFTKVRDINVILTTFKQIGFDDVLEVAKGAEIVTKLTKEMMDQKKISTPIISSACPAVVRLIKVRFPSLIEHLLPIESPMEVAALIARNEAVEKTGLKPEEIGIFFISPCAAKVTAVKAPIGREKSDIDGVISMKEAYLKIAQVISKVSPEKIAIAGPKGVGWANNGGESYALGDDDYIDVDGIDNVIDVLEKLEDDKLTGIKFVEAGACIGGCVGGPLTVENGFVAKTRVKRLMRNLVKNNTIIEKNINIELDEVMWTKPVEYTPIMKLDQDMKIAMEKMDKMEEIEKNLPKLDCGSCGAPSCTALAEDIVRGFSSESACIYRVREKIKELAKEMMTLEENMSAYERNNHN